MQNFKSALSSVSKHTAWQNARYSFAAVVWFQGSSGRVLVPSASRVIGGQPSVAFSYHRFGELHRQTVWRPPSQSTCRGREGVLSAFASCSPTLFASSNSMRHGWRRHGCRLAAAKGTIRRPACPHRAGHAFTHRKGANKIGNGRVSWRLVPWLMRVRNSTKQRAFTLAA